MPTPPPSPTDAAPRTPGRWGRVRRGVRRLARWVGYGVGGLGLLVVLLLLVVQTDWGARTVGRTVIGWVNPFETATIDVGRIDGSWLTSLSLYDVTITRGDSARLVQVDTLRLRYRLWPLLYRTLHVRDAYLANPTVTLTQGADSTWDLLAALPEDTTTADTAASGFRIQVDRLRLRRGRAAVHFFAPDRDSTLRIHRLDTRLDSLVLAAGSATLALPRFAVALSPPGVADTVDVHLEARLAHDRLSVDTLRLASAASAVSGGGSLRLPGAGRPGFDALDASLTAAPLAFRDLQPFVPALNPRASVTADLSVHGSADSLEAVGSLAFADGGTLTLNAAGTPRTAGPLAYHLDGTVRGLDPAYLTGDPAREGTLNADLRVDLQGSALDSLNGTVRAVLFDTRYAAYTPARTTLDLTFVDGRSTLALATGIFDAGLTVSGRLRPFADPPTYALEGTVSDLDVGRFAADAGTSSALNGTFRVDGSGRDLPGADLTASLTLAPSRLNRAPLTGGTLTARLAGGVLNATTRLETPSGHLDARAEARLTEEPIRYRLDETRFETLDVAALLGAPAASAFTGTLALRGSGTDPAADLRLDALSLMLDRSAYGPYRIYHTRLNASLGQGRLDLSAEADVEGGQATLTATARPFDRVPTFAVTDGAFSHVDIGPLLQNPDQRSDLTGTLTLSLRGADPAAMTLDARLDLSPSTVNDQRIQEARLIATLDDGTMAFSTRLTVPGGRTAFAGTAVPFADVPTLTLTDGRIDGLDVGAFLGVPHLDTDLNGAISSLTLQGTDPAAMTLDAVLDLDASRLNDEPIQSGRVRVTLDDGLADADVDLDLEQGAVRLTSTGRLFDAPPTYTLKGTLQDLDLRRLAGLDTLAAGFSADVDLRGAGFDPAAMTLEGRIDVANARYDGVRATLLATRFALDDGLLNVDTLYVRSNVADIDAGGPIALYDTSRPSAFAFAATVRDLEPVRPFVGADALGLVEGTIRGRLFGPPGVLRYDAATTLTGLTYDDLRLAGLKANATGTLDSTLTASVDSLTATLNSLSTPTFFARSTNFSLTTDADTVSFEADTILDQRRDARLTGRVALDEDNPRVSIDTLFMRLDDDRWQLLQEASVSYGDEYRVSNLLLYEADSDQQIAVDGVIDLDGDQSLILTIEQFRIGSVADLFGLPGLNGTLNGYVDLTGAATAPRMNGQLMLDVESYDRAVGDLRLDVRYDSLRLHLDAALTHDDGSTLALQGYLPVDLRLSEPADPEASRVPRVSRGEPLPAGDVNLHVVADRFNIGWIEPFLDPEMIDEVEGRLSGTVDVLGTLDEPVLSGDAALSEGRLHFPLLGLSHEHARADVSFVDDQVQINHAEVHTGSGSLVATGTIDLTQLTLGEFDIEASAEEFRAIDTREYRMLTSGDLVLRGTTREPVLTGDVKLLSADIYLTDETSADEFEPVELTARDIQMLERYFGIRVTEADTTTFDFYEALAIDLDVEMERDVWIRSPKNPDMNIQFTGELEVTKVPYAEEQVFGTIEVIQERSFINQFGKRFNIQSGTLTFNGPATDPRFDISATYEVRARGKQATEITITLLVTGRLEDLNLEFTSDPPTDLTNIVSYIATGRPANQAFQLGGSGGGGALDIGTEFALSQLAGVVESAAGSELGLDVIEIRQEGLEGTTITAGKYLSRRFYAAVSWPIAFSGSFQENRSQSADGKQFTIEYELFNWLLARLTGNGTTLRMILIYEYAY